MTAGQASEIIQLLQGIFAVLLILMTLSLFHVVVYWRDRGLTWPWPASRRTPRNKHHRKGDQPH